MSGTTNSLTFPITILAFQPSLKAKAPDAFITKIASQTFTLLSPLKLTFSTQLIGTVSAAKKVTLTNTGTNSLTINKIYTAGLNAGDFSETNTCGGVVAAGASCTISVTFTPTDKNLRHALLGLSDSDPASPQGVTLSGAGTVVYLSTKKLPFGNHPVGTTSAPQSVTLTNIGSTQLNFTGITITGTNPMDFSQTNTCGTSIAAKASCTLTVRFKPTATGTRKASLSVSDDGGASPQRVYLTGTGT